MEIIKEWTTEVGHVARIIKQSMGHLCGYVGIPKDHKLFEKSYHDEIDYTLPMDEPVSSRGVIPLLLRATLPPKEGKESLEMIFDVHGSLTFSGKFENSELWWLGYDCAHCDDTPEVCNLEFCISQCESLSKQIRDKIK